MIDHILVRYGELSTKGNNRSDFERRLVRNIERMIRSWPKAKVARTSGRAVISLHGEEPGPIMERLRHVFGIQSFSAVEAANLDMESILEIALRCLDEGALKNPAAKTFKVEAKRGNKRFPLRAPEISAELGHLVLTERPQWKVDVHNPDVTIWVDVRDEAAYIFSEKVRGAGGLPVGMSGRVGLLLSGGIDSPVAGWSSMKRGLIVDAVHFESYPFTSERALAKVQSLSQQLANYAGRLYLYQVSLTEIQSAIHKHCPEPLRTIVMRRMMVRIASQLAVQHGWLALVTGDSIGQVASQTLEGIHVLDEVTTLPILRPLVTMDKVDIIQTSMDIGTYETSILPYDDCCSIFAPKSPKTRPTREDAKRAEAELEIALLVDNAIAGARQTRYESEWSVKKDKDEF
jgi:tRNA uracil 4-sulfurtransferase